MNRKQLDHRMAEASGRIVLPREAGTALGWDERTQVEIWVNTSQKEIVIRKRKNSCVFCGTTEGLLEYRGQRVCEGCRKNLREETR